MSDTGSHTGNHTEFVPSCKMEITNTNITEDAPTIEISEIDKKRAKNRLKIRKKNAMIREVWRAVKLQEKMDRGPTSEIVNANITEDIAAAKIKKSKNKRKRERKKLTRTPLQKKKWKQRLNRKQKEKMNKVWKAHQLAKKCQEKDLSKEISE